MKKTLIAFAALSAIAGAAQAQSSVTLYGVADAYTGVIENKSKVGAAAETKVSQGVVNGSGLSSSRWGLRGSEDLGGGIKGIFTLESGFDISTGASANGAGNSAANQSSILFGRQAFVGLSGGFGTVALGRQYTAYDALRAATNNVYDSNTFATTSTVWSTGLVDYSNRTNNAISYASPDFAGFSGAIVYGFGEDKGINGPAVVPAAGAQVANNTDSTSSSTSLHIKYANGPLVVGYAHQREKAAIGSVLFAGTTNNSSFSATAAGTAATFADTRKYNLFGASYDFGVAKINGSYNQAKGQLAAGVDAKDKEFQVGVSVPFGAAAVAAGYSRSKSDAGGVQNIGTGFSLLGTYSLSKRTTLYAGGLSLKAESGLTAATDRTDKRTLLAIGARHTF
jgi:predicted porin